MSMPLKRREGVRQANYSKKVKKYGNGKIT